MIKRLRIHNFKTFLNFEMDFTRRHLVIGKNNSGKTNLCYALRFLGNSVWLDYDKAEIPGGLGNFCHRGFDSAVAEFQCHCELPFEGETLGFQYDLQIKIPRGKDLSSSSPGDLKPRTHLERLIFVRGSLPRAASLPDSESGPDWAVVLLASDGKTVQLFDERHLGEGTTPTRLYVVSPEEDRAPDDASMLSKLYASDTNPRAMLFREFLGTIVYHCFSPALMRHGWTLHQHAAVPTSLGPHGHDLPLLLFRLKNEDEPSYRRVLGFLSEIDPDVDSINFYVTPDNKPIPYVMLKNRGQATWDSLSDGTLCVLALATTFVQADRQEEDRGRPLGLTLLEEPENSLYRGLFHSLWEEFSALAPMSQFVFTSHSPYFIDLFDRDLENISRFKKDGGVTTAKSLAEYRDLIERHRDEYDLSLGEQHYKEVFE